MKAIVDFATGCLIPDLTLLLDIDVEEGLRRRAGEGSFNRLDAFELAFHQRVREGYLQMAKADSHRWVVIDASGSFNQVQIELRQIVHQRLGQTTPL